MRRLVLLSLCILLSGCSNSTPTNYEFTKKSDPPQSSKVNDQWAKNSNDDIPFIYPTNTFNLDLITNETTYIPNWNKKKIENTSSLLFYLKGENTLDEIQIENIIEGFTGIQYNYVCSFENCYMRNTRTEAYFYQGIIISPTPKTVLTKAHFNELYIAVFGVEPSYLIDETKVLNNGIVQSKEEDTFVGINPDSSSTTRQILVVKDYTESKDTLTLHLILFNGDYTQQPFNETMKYKDRVEYIDNHPEEFEQWKLTLQNNKSDLFYRIISLNRK